MKSKQGSYAQFVELTANEGAFLRDVVANCPTDQRNEPPDEVLLHLQSVTDITILLRLAEKCPLIEAWCELSAMQRFWDTIWADSAGRKPTPREAANNPKLIYRPLVTQTTISSFNLLRGVWLYNHANSIARQYGLENEHVQVLLDKANRYHCFESIRATNRIQMTKLFNGDTSIEFENIVNDLTQEIEYHGTPILLLLALSYYEAADLESEENSTNSDHYLCLALMYVNLAEQVANLSANAIHNAYYGHGLSESNHYGWDTFAKWHEGILEDIEADYQCVIISRASQWADNFIRQNGDNESTELVFDSNVTVRSRITVAAFM